MLTVRSTVPEAAKLYRMPTRTLYDWVAEGRLCHHRDDGHITVDLAEVDQLYHMDLTTRTCRPLSR
jgi:excisionase family DNA binding protein